MTPTDEMIEALRPLVRADLQCDDDTAVRVILSVLRQLGEAGRVVVPKEPTEAMFIKGGGAILSSGLPVCNTGTTIANAAITVYRAMLSISEEAGG